MRVSEEVARTLAEEGSLEPALKRYQRLAQQAPADADHQVIGYQIKAAELKRKLGRHQEASEDLEAILLRLRPSSWLYSDVRGRIEAAFVRSGDYSALADYYHQQAEKHPDDLDLKQRHARSLANAGRIAEAIEAMNKTIKFAPDNEELRLALIDIYRRTGKHADVDKQFEALVKLDPDNPDYLIAWGDSKLEEKSVERSQRVRAAVAIWKRLADARADDPVMTAKVADLMRRVDRSEEALKLYRRSIKLAPTEPQYREYLGEYLHHLDRKDEALETWASIAQGQRRSRESLIRLAEVLTVFDYDKQALAAFAEAETLDLDFQQRLRYATLLFRAEQVSQALDQLDKAETVAETPEQRDQILQDRIDIYAGSGTLLKQIADFHTNLGADADAADYRTLALMLDSAWRRTEAIVAIDTAVELAPKGYCCLVRGGGDLPKVFPL